jgi:hypothetical protein
LLQEVDVKFDALPTPHLEESDVVRVYTDEFNSAFRLNEFSIPLTTKALMSVGYTAKVSFGLLTSWKQVRPQLAPARRRIPTATRRRK